MIKKANYFIGLIIVFEKYLESTWYLSSTLVQLQVQITSNLHFWHQDIKYIKY